MIKFLKSVQNLPRIMRSQLTRKNTKANLTKDYVSEENTFSDLAKDEKKWIYPRCLREV